MGVFFLSLLLVSFACICICTFFWSSLKRIKQTILISREQLWLLGWKILQLTGQPDDVTAVCILSSEGQENCHCFEAITYLNNDDFVGIDSIA
jgi:hypothetical protein